MLRRIQLSIVLCALLPPAGCSQKSDSIEDDGRINRSSAIDPAKSRKSSLLDRVDDERKQADASSRPAATGSSNSGLPPSSRGSGLFAFGSSGVDDIQLAARDQNTPLDLRLLETDSVETTYKVQFDRGEQLLNRGQFDQALICFDEAKSINPKNYQAYVGEAFAYFRKGDFGRASAAIDQAIRVAPQIVVLYNHRAHISAQLGDIRKAIDDLDHVLKMQPEDVSSLLSRSQCQVMLNNHTAAIADYTAALKLRPNDAGVLMQRAISYFRTNKFKECVADTTAVINQRRDQIDPFFVRAVAKANLNDVDGGRNDFDEAVKLGLSPQMIAMWRPRFYPNQPGKAGP